MKKLHNKKWVALGIAICITFSIIAMPVLADVRADTAQATGVTSATNSRQLGGYVGADGRAVRENMLIRTGRTTNITDEDAALLNTFGITDIIDFRSPDEIEADPPSDKLNGKVHNIPATAPRSSSGGTNDSEPTYQTEDLEKLVNSGGNAVGIYNYTYSNLVSNDYSIDTYKQFFDVLLDAESGAIMYNCTGGKDRTGVATMLLLSALGVDRETITYDYLLTNDHIADYINTTMASAAEETEDETLLEQLRYFISVDESLIEIAYSTIESNYGSMDEYLEQALGLTEDKLTILRDKYLE